MRKLSAVLTILILTSLLVPAVVAQEQDVAGDDPVALTNPDIVPFVQGEPAAVPEAPSPDDVLWDQYNTFTGTNFAAQDFETAYDIYDIWSADDFENGEAWNIETIVTRGGWTGYVDLSNATAIHWYICGDAGGEPDCLPENGTAYWEIHLAPSDPQVSLGVVEPEDIWLTLDTPINLPAGTWWLVHQASLEYGLYGQWGWSGTDYVYGAILAQHNPGGGFGLPDTWTPNDYGYDAMFRLEGTVGGMQEPDIRVEPESLEAELCPDSQTTMELQICNDGTAGLEWALEEIPGGYIEALLYENGPLVTHPGGGFGGADASVLQTNLGLSTYGFGHQYFYGYRVADDFVVPGGEEWYIDAIEFYAYQTNAPTDPSTMLAYNLAVWDGPPAAGGSIIWGDYVTNCMIDSVWMGAYRVTDYDMMGTARPVMISQCETPGLVLAEGQYWLDWQADGSLSSGPWAPPISILGETTTGDALQSLDNGVSFADLIDSGSGTPQGLPFNIYGDTGGQPDIPWLSEDPTQGYVEPGDCQIVNVTFDSTGLAPDTYMGELLINSDDPDEPETFVPVTLTVVPCENTMHVENIFGMFKFPYLLARVQVADQAGMPLGDALVEVTIGMPAMEWARYRVTKPNGWARFWAPLGNPGNYEICVDNLTLAGYTYDPSQNVWTCRDWDW